MKRSQVILTQKAEKNYINSFVYYQKQQKGLGLRFENEVDEMLDAISNHPLLFQRKYKHYREAVLKVFPFVIVYEINLNIVVVMDIFHVKRNPGKKNKRKK